MLLTEGCCGAKNNTWLMVKYEIHGNRQNIVLFFQFSLSSCLSMFTILFLFFLVSSSFLHFEKFYSTSISLSLLTHLRWEIINPHCGAASGLICCPYFRVLIHLQWCAWCPHNSICTWIRFASITQSFINSRDWKKYSSFIKTVNLKPPP